MPEIFCDKCQQFAPAKWDAINRCWKWWGHQTADRKSCSNSDKVTYGRMKTRQDQQNNEGEKQNDSAGD